MGNLETAKMMADLLESRDLQNLQVLLSEDFKAKGASSELNKGQTLGFLKTLFTAFPDHRFGFEDFEEKDNLVHCSGLETGTHQGVLDLKPFGMPITLDPTWRSFILPKCAYTFRVSGDKVTYYTEEAVHGGGMKGILEQLGIKPS